jgi:2-succinyl-6-hydroxy-2,4-cyclohexadiene-1-carboxylate synthase
MYVSTVVMILGNMPPTVVLLHGFTHTGASWDPVVAALGERYRALAPDIRGHAAAGEREPVTVEAVVADVAALAPPRFKLAGYSMGGRLALHVALALSERVERLVLIGASPGVADSNEREARRRADDALAAEIERSSIEQFALRWASMPMLADQPPAVAAAAHADRLRNTPAGLARALRGLGTGVLPPAWDRLGELAMPVTLVAGERDERFRGVAAEMAPAIADVNVVVVPDAGHAVHLEAPAAVARAIQDADGPPQ